MRVLIVHNQYRSDLPSGENRAVDDHVSVLRDAGVETETFFRHSDAIQHFTARQKAALVVSSTYSFEAARAFRRTMDEFGPDVVHLHNPLPLISPAIIRTAKHRGIPVVQTVHNHRHSCVSSMGLFRDGHKCEDCLGKTFPWPGAIHGCYHDSRIQSTALAVSAGVHKATYELVDRFFAVTGMVANTLQTMGIPAERIVLHPNAARSRGPVLPLGSGFLFVGRLTAEKGIGLLMEAWAASSVRHDHELVIAGDGPDRGLVLSANEATVRFEGLVSSERVNELLDACAVVVIPSIWTEGFPLVVAEAFERGRPVVSTADSLADFITPNVGWTADPHSTALAAALAAAMGDKALAEKGRAARRVFEESLSRERSLERLLHVYEEVTDRSRPRVAGGSSRA